MGVAWLDQVLVSWVQGRSPYASRSCHGYSSAKSRQTSGNEPAAPLVGGGRGRRCSATVPWWHRRMLPRYGRVSSIRYYDRANYSGPTGPLISCCPLAPLVAGWRSVFSSRSRWRPGCACDAQSMAGPWHTGSLRMGTSFRESGWKLFLHKRGKV